MNLIFSDDQVTVSLSSEEFNEIFQVNGDNHLLVQRSDLSKASGQYTVDVEGQGCAFIQVMEFCEEYECFPGKNTDHLFSYVQSAILLLHVFEITFSFIDIFHSKTKVIL